MLNADNRAFPFELLHQLLEVAGCPNREVWDEGCFRSIGRGHDQGSGALLSGQISKANHATTGAQASVQSQFTSTPKSFELGAVQLTAGYEQPQRDR